MRTYRVMYRCSYFDGPQDEPHVAHIQADTLREAKRTAKYQLDWRCGKGTHQVLGVRWLRP